MNRSVDQNNSVAIVTGGARGAGSTIAKTLAKCGDRVIVNYFRSDVLAAQVVDEIMLAGGWAMSCQADVTDAEAARRMVARVVNKCGRVDFLVNNAGHFEPGSLFSTSAQSWLDSFSCNVLGAFNCAAACVPYMNTRGVIVNISSLAGIYPSSGTLAYSVSKAGLIALSKCLAGELGPGIRVNCIVPGFMKTDMTAKVDDESVRARTEITALKRLCTPQDVADAVVYLVHQATYMTGQTLVLDGGLYLR